LFKPAQKDLWISTPPYQLGEFIGYNLSDVFSDHGNFQAVDSLTIGSDPFLGTADYKKFEAFKSVRQKITKYVMLDAPLTLTPQAEKEFIANNAGSYLPYFYLGEYHRKNSDFRKAITYYEQALKREVPSANEHKSILAKIEDCKNNRR
jgi:hypothetical protein